MNPDCPHCGLSFDPAKGPHGCPESRPNPDLVTRLRYDHGDTQECEHGFSLYDDGINTCPNPVCLRRDLREAANEIDRLQDAVAEFQRGDES